MNNGAEFFTKSQNQLALAKNKSNFINNPGTHSWLSPIPGERWNDFQKIIKKMEIFKEFQSEIYSKANIYVIPMVLKNDADEISKKIFSDYLEKYKNFGITIENAVCWVDLDYTRTRISDLENEFTTWFTRAHVSKPEHESHLKKGFYRPAYICALHELMHVEETPMGITKDAFDEFNSVDEVLTVTKTIILMDFVFKTVKGIPLEQEADYGVTFSLSGKSITQGEFANFYRNLEIKYNSLADALTSEESLTYFNGELAKQTAESILSGKPKTPEANQALMSFYTSISPDTFVETRNYLTSLPETLSNCQVLQLLCSSNTLSETLVTDGEKRTLKIDSENQVGDKNHSNNKKRKNRRL